MEHVLLLHGAIGSKDQLELIKKKLAESFVVHSLNFNGHGADADNGAPFSIGSFASEIIAYLEKHSIQSIHIFGFSMGGYVAMFLAKYFPERTGKIITLATKFAWDEDIAAREIKMLNAAKIEEKLPDFAATLQQRHAPNNWKTVLEKTAALLDSIGKDNPLKTADYAGIQNPVLLLLGDRDKMVSLEETVEVYKSLPNAQLAVLPNTVHPVEAVNTDRLANEIRTFLL